MAKQLSIDNYKRFFYNSQAAMLIIDTDAPHYTMLDVNDAYLFATNTTREDLIGKSVFGVFPANPTDNVSKNIERTIFSFEQAIKNKVPHVMQNYRYDIPIPGTDEFEERYWTTSNTPVLDELGEVIYFIHSPANVTEWYKLNEREQQWIEKLKKQQEQLYSTFMQAPVGVAIFNGPGNVVELINPPMCEIYDKPMHDLLGKPIFDVLTLAKGQGFEELLEKVRLTGESYKGQNIMVPLVRDGIAENVYVNFVYEPFRDSSGIVTGVIGVAAEVTELINTQNKIEEAEERARLAADAVGLGTFDLNMTTGELYSSERLANIFGFDKPVPQRDYINVIHPDDIAAWKQAHIKGIETGKLLYEIRVIRKDGSVHWVRGEGKVFYNNEGKAVRISGTMLDFTEQRKAKEEQRKLTTLVDNSVDLMSILNMDGTNSYINQAGIELLGFDNEEQVTSTPISALHTPEDYQFVEREVLPSVMRYGRWEGVMQVRHLKTGEVFPVFNNCIRIDDPVSGGPIAVGAVMRDMRPELAAKKALADSERFLRNITTAAPTTLWAADHTGSINYVNQTWVDWTGYSLNDHKGFGWMHAILPEDRQRAEELWIKNFAARKRYETEFRLKHVDGTIHWCLANGQPQYGDDGSFLGYIGACVDITEQKQLQQQKDDFIGIASHELKTPVTSIKAYAQVLEKMLRQKGDIKESQMITRMDAQINRLTSLIGDLLDVTKINSGKLQFNYEEFDFNQMVKDLIEDLQRTTQKHRLIERYSKTGMLYADKERIGQVITNLITNAIKYSPHTDQVIISTELRGNEVTLCVQDFGIGISKDKLEKVFEQFYRVSGDMQHTFPGLGLGLYISSEIIKREGGRIWVTSTEGKGSTFCFALPVNKADRKIG